MSKTEKTPDLVEQTLWKERATEQCHESKVQGISRGLPGDLFHPGQAWDKESHLC